MLAGRDVFLQLTGALILPLQHWLVSAVRWLSHFRGVAHKVQAEGSLDTYNWIKTSVERNQSVVGWMPPGA